MQSFPQQQKLSLQTKTSNCQTQRSQSHSKDLHSVDRSCLSDWDVCLNPIEQQDYNTHPFSYLYKQFGMIQISDQEPSHELRFKKKRKVDESGSNIQMIHSQQPQNGNIECLKQPIRSGTFQWVQQIIEMGYNKEYNKIIKARTDKGQELYFDYTLIRNQNPKLLCKYYQSKLITKYRK